MTVFALGAILFGIGGFGVSFLTLSIHYLNIFSNRFIKRWSIYVLLAFIMMVVWGGTLMLEYNEAPLWMW
jgi:hypothetical protein